MDHKKINSGKGLPCLENKGLQGNLKAASLYLCGFTEKTEMGSLWKYTARREDHPSLISELTLL